MNSHKDKTPYRLAPALVRPPRARINLNREYIEREADKSAG